jgi:hypothetical protein
VTAGDFALSEHVAANMSINVATGQAWVPGTSAAGQGQYYIRNNATVNLAITASNETNPRIDKVVLRIKDESVAGSGNEAVLEVIKGTAEAGATLVNRKGVGATPVSSLVLGYVLVPAKATTIVAADIENVAAVLRLTGEPVTPASVSTGYQAQVTRSAGTEYEPSPTRPTFVVLELADNGEAAHRISVQVGGVTIGNLENLAPAAIGRKTISFICPPGVKWKATNVDGTGIVLMSSYLPL